ncbi:NUDIX domain-containing protein [Teredinibacter sp. KSP-S5-2]|uniref:NUDIX domain-containing protein n=1 Tax=Teredinibacter sp. KSP-S5-2 TaxID=3034506 RepID=UPI0029346B6C|nr:NUDIX domain-containing protein [Teredinibacter sp. KSP-S5-2]WNO10858.1 NUDIX domain-containing protein [Teredinibacter sp. KSP-S5-2]
MDKKFTILESNTTYNGFFKLISHTIQHSLFQGGLSQAYTREVLERGHAVAVLLHDPQLDQIVLIEQFRIGAIHSENPWLIELVAGIVEPGELPEDVAIREAEEECGAQIENLELITSYFNSAGGSTETTTIYYAHVDASTIEGVHGLDSENEDIRVVKMGTQDFLNKVTNNEFNTASLVTAGYWLLSKVSSHAF